MRQQSFLKRMAVVVAVVLSGLLAMDGRPASAVDAKQILKEIEKLLKQEVQKQVTGLVSKELVRFDRGTGTLALSPLFLQGMGYFLQQQSSLFKKFNVRPQGNQLGLEATTSGGTSVALNLIPQNIEFDLKEMTLTGLIPGGLKVNLPEASQSSISALFDSVMGVAPKVSQLLSRVTIEGETFKLRRPLKVTVLPRLLNLDPAMGGAIKHNVPISMQDGWLTLNLGIKASKDQLMSMGIEMLLMRVKDVVAGKIGGSLGGESSGTPSPGGSSNPPPVAAPAPTTIPASVSPPVSQPVPDAPVGRPTPADEVGNDAETAAPSTPTSAPKAPPPGQPDLYSTPYDY